jgi:myosin heavy subunit
VAQDSHTLEVKQLKAQMRTLCDNQSLTDVFATFESDVARLVRENESLRQMNLELEARELDAFLRASEKRLGGAGAAGSPTSPTASGAAAAVGTGAEGEVGGSESYRLQAVKRENLRLVTRLKKSGQEREALRTSYEELKAKERQFVINTKIANDSARRLRSTHQELQRTKRELEEQSAARAAAERDLQLVREDTKGMRVAEAALREERSQLLSEVASLRERVREVDHESRRLAQLNRFVHKHTTAAPPPATSSVARPSPSAASAGHQVHSSTKASAPTESSHTKAAPPLPFQAYRAHIAAVLGGSALSSAVKQQPLQSGVEETKDHSAHDSASTTSSSGRSQSYPEGTVGQAGLSEAQYLRLEESDGIEPALEVSLTAMHESLLATQPTLLPLFRKLTTDIHAERTRALQKRSQLLNMVAPKQYEQKASPPRDRVNSTSSRSSSSGAYAALVKEQRAQQNYATAFETKQSVGQVHGTKSTKKTVRF